MVYTLPRLFFCVLPTLSQFVADFQFGYGMGLHNAFSPLLFNSVWIDSVYSSYGLDYMRPRSNTIVPPNGLHSPMNKGKYTF